MTWWRIVLAVAVAGVLAGCAGPQAMHPEQPGTGQPTDLVGLWRIEAPGEEPGTILRLGTDLSIWRECDEQFGGWAANSAGGFVGETFAYTYECNGPKPTKPPKPEMPSSPTTEWLTKAVGYRVDGVDRVLVDEHGGTVARLRPSGEPSARRMVAHELYAKPPMDAALRRMLSPAAALPANLRPATRSELIGTWKPTTAGANPGQFITIRADGSWNGSDGCNGQSGRWTITSPGAVLTVAGATTLIGCAGQDRAPQFRVARGAGLAGETLVLLNAQGNELGRLNRTS
jgi:hypothetical protein